MAEAHDATKKTSVSGYQEIGPVRGGKRCGLCRAFVRAKGGCGNEHVMADPKVPKLADGLGKVSDLRGLCDYFHWRSEAHERGLRG